MLDSIYIGLSGLISYARGLRTISNNVANLNTPGFRSSQLQFTDLFYSGGQAGPQSGYSSDGGSGLGVTTLSATLNWRHGEFRQTGNTLDLAIDGDGLFVVRNDAGQLRYTRSGEFEFNKDGILVNRADGSHVLAIDDAGRLTEIKLDGLRTNTAKPTSTVNFQGNLSSDGTDHLIGSVKVFDALGGEHNLAVKFTNGAPATPGTWTVTVTDGATTVATGSIGFVNGRPNPATSSLSFTYSPAGVDPLALKFDFGADVTSFAAGTTSTLAMGSQDGFASGALTQVSFDQQGHLTLSYANGQTTHNQRLALARLDTLQALESVGGNLFASRDDSAVHFSSAGEGGLGHVNAGTLELSNVDLSQEFSDLIVTQRGYQASSQIISTVNEMIQVVLDMKSRR